MVLPLPNRQLPSNPCHAVDDIDFEKRAVLIADIYRTIGCACIEAIDQWDGRVEPGACGARQDAQDVDIVEHVLELGINAIGGMLVDLVNEGAGGCPNDRDKALLLRSGIEQDTPHEPMRFIDVGGELTLQAKLRDTWEHIYRVIPYPRYDSEYEITNWYTGTHPNAVYQSNIIVARPGPNRTRITMFNARVTVRHATGEAERRLLTDEADYQSVLRDEFGLKMTDDEIRTCINVMHSKGEKGPPHPFFA